MTSALIPQIPILMPSWFDSTTPPLAYSRVFACPAHGCIHSLVVTKGSTYVNNTRIRISGSTTCNAGNRRAASPPSDVSVLRRILLAETCSRKRPHSTIPLSSLTHSLTEPLVEPPPHVTQRLLPASSLLRQIKSWHVDGSSGCTYVLCISHLGTVPCYLFSRTVYLLSTKSHENGSNYCNVENLHFIKSTT